MRSSEWRITLAAAGLMALAMGGRSAFALFVSPLNTATGMGLAVLSLAFAAGQLGIGFVQPWIGSLADRFGARRIVRAGAWALTAATVLPALAPVPAVVALSAASGTMLSTTVGSNGLLLGEVNRRVAVERAGYAVALVSAGSSLGQLLIAPAVQWQIAEHGWRIALALLAATFLLALPITRYLAPAGASRRDAATPPGSPTTPFAAEVLRRWTFWRIAGSFAVCGFHVGFLGAHMPGVIERCGLPPSLAGTWLAVAGAANIAGSLAIGVLLRRYRPELLLALTYLLRGIAVAAMLVVTPTLEVMLAFALLMGATHMATLPPTTQIVARDFGTAQIGMLLGLVMLVHQAGSFTGVALGGWAAEATGDDHLLWTVDAVLALVAAALAWQCRTRPSTSGPEAREAGPSPRLSPRIAVTVAPRACQGETRFVAVRLPR